MDKIIFYVIRNFYWTTFPWRIVSTESAACPLAVIPSTLVFPLLKLKLTTTYWALLKGSIEHHILTADIKKMVSHLAFERGSNLKLKNFKTFTRFSTIAKWLHPLIQKHPVHWLEGSCACPQQRCVLLWPCITLQTLLLLLPFHLAQIPQLWASCSLLVPRILHLDLYSQQTSCSWRLHVGPSPGLCSLFSAFFRRPSLLPGQLHEPVTSSHAPPRT